MSNDHSERSTSTEKVPHSGRLSEDMRETPVREFDNTPLLEAHEQGLLEAPDSATDIIDTDEIPVQGGSTEPTQEVSPNRRGMSSGAKKATAITALLATALGGALYLGLKPSGNTDTEHAGNGQGHEQVEKSLNDVLLENIDKRPVPGTPEYDEFFSSKYAVPYIEGQSQDDVLLGLEISLNRLLEGAGTEDAPRDTTAWQIEQSKSMNDLLDVLDLEYHQRGALSQIADPSIIDSLMAGPIPAMHRDYSLGIMLKEIKRTDGKLVLTSTNLVTHSPTDFSASPNISSEDGRDLGGNTLSARAVDVDGDNKPDVWRIYSTPTYQG